MLWYNAIKILRITIIWQGVSRKNTFKISISNLLLWLLLESETPIDSEVTVQISVNPYGFIECLLLCIKNCDQDR